VSAAPLLGLDAQLVGAVVLVQDLTRVRGIEQDMQRRVARLMALGVELEELPVSEHPRPGGTGRRQGSLGGGSEVAGGDPSSAPS
jgi:hypothetical protein